MTALESLFPIDPQLDLVLERTIDVPPELVWRAWTEPEHMRHWFCPRLWGVVDCEIDLRPGGIFRTVFLSPEGQKIPNVGCYLEIVPNERLIWTDALLPGYRPAENPFMTAVLLLEPAGSGTRYVARAIHGDESTRRWGSATGGRSALISSSSTSRGCKRPQLAQDCRSLRTGSPDLTAWSINRDR